MLYVASVKDGKQIKIIKCEYETKKAFSHDLRANGYKIRFIATPETFDAECDKYYYKLKTQHYIRKAKREYNAKHKKHAGQ